MVSDETTLQVVTTDLLSEPSDAEAFVGAPSGTSQTAESGDDQPESLPACTNTLNRAPAGRSEETTDVVVRSSHIRPPKPTRYFSAPDTAGQDQVIALPTARHNTDGAEGALAGGEPGTSTTPTSTQSEYSMLVPLPLLYDRMETIYALPRDTWRENEL